MPAAQPGARPRCGSRIDSTPIRRGRSATRSPSSSSTSRPSRARRGPRRVWAPPERARAAVGAGGIGAEAVGALHGLGGVGDDAVAPAPDLVAEEPEAARPSARRPRRWRRHRARRRAPRTGACSITKRALRHEDLERRVVEVARGRVRESRRDHLEHLSVQTNGVAAGTERQPVEVDACEMGRSADRLTASWCPWSYGKAERRDAGRHPRLRRDPAAANHDSVLRGAAEAAPRSSGSASGWSSGRPCSGRR